MKMRIVIVLGLIILSHFLILQLQYVFHAYAYARAHAPRFFAIAALELAIRLGLGFWLVRHSIIRQKPAKIKRSIVVAIALLSNTGLTLFSILLIFLLFALGIYRG